MISKSDRSKTIEVGRLKDRVNEYGRHEQFIIEIPFQTLTDILGELKNFYLILELERQPAFLGMSDDFVWTRLDTLDCGIKMTWK